MRQLWGSQRGLGVEEDFEHLLEDKVRWNLWTKVDQINVDLFKNLKQEQGSW